MKLGKFFAGWRPILWNEAQELELAPSIGLRGFFIEWGDPENGFGLLLMIEEKL